MDFSKSLMPEKSLQVTRLRLVTWKDFSGIRDLEKSILALPNHRIGPFFLQFLIGGQDWSTQDLGLLLLLEH